MTFEAETQRVSTRRSKYTGAWKRRLDTAAMSGFRRKPPKVIFYAIPTTDREKWRLLAHFPGSPIKHIASFDGKAEAEAWASGSEGQDWVRATYGE
jgi:hypothetical protein